jgi:hypothetical protein
MGVSSAAYALEHVSAYRRVVHVGPDGDSTEQYDDGKGERIAHGI